MTEKELRKMKRPALLEILVSQSREIDRLKAELEQKNKELENRQILIEKSGSLAEASLEIYHVLESAQAAADLYLENIKRNAQSAYPMISGIPGKGKNGTGTAGNMPGTGQAGTSATRRMAGTPEKEGRA